MRRSRPALGLTLLAVAALATGFRNVPFLTGDQVMQKVHDALAASSELDLVKLITMSSAGDVESRELVSAVQRDDQGNTYYLLRFLEPVDIRGTTLLAIEHKGGDVEQYLYLPGLGEPRKIEGSGRAGYFMGSDFTFEDMRKERGTDWKYARLDDDMVDGTDCYAILSSPSDESREKITGYANRIVYVDKNTYVIRRIEFFNDKNERLKVFDAYDYQGPNGQPQRPRRGVMTNNSKNTTTVMSLLDSKTNAPLAPDMFTLDTIEHWGPDQDHVIQAALPKAAEPTP